VAEVPPAFRSPAGLSTRWSGRPGFSPSPGFASEQVKVTGNSRHTWVRRRCRRGWAPGLLRRTGMPPGPVAAGRGREALAPQGCPGPGLQTWARPPDSIDLGARGRQNAPESRRRRSSTSVNFISSIRRHPITPLGDTHGCGSRDRKEMAPRHCIEPTPSEAPSRTAPVAGALVASARCLG
jgi:hypothetical protein